MTPNMIHWYQNPIKLEGWLCALSHIALSMRQLMAKNKMAAQGEEMQQNSEQVFST